jgi:small conductance mechanosensitive channel
MPVHFAAAWKSGEKIIDGAIALLPNLILALVVFVVFLIVASFSKSVTQKFAVQRQRRQGAALLLARLVHTLIVVLGFLIALSIVAPSFRAGNLITMLGIGSVAIGFAFQNILQNFLAGVLILINEPFHLGDFISVTGIEGNVDDIQGRATIVSTKEGRKVFIPNATLFTNPVAVHRANQQLSPSNPSSPTTPTAEQTQKAPEEAKGSGEHNTLKNQ